MPDVQIQVRPTPILLEVASGCHLREGSIKAPRVIVQKNTDTRYMRGLPGTLKVIPRDRRAVLPASARVMIATDPVATRANTKANRWGCRMNGMIRPLKKTKNANMGIAIKVRLVTIRNT